MICPAPGIAKLFIPQPGIEYLQHLIICPVFRSENGKIFHGTLNHHPVSRDHWVEVPFVKFKPVFSRDEYLAFLENLEKRAVWPR